jgi:recombination associated protein RdgC
MTFKPLQFGLPVTDLLNNVFLGGAPQRFAVGRECRMRDAVDVRSVVRWANFDLSDPSIRDHVGNGMQLTHLEIVYDSIVSLVLDENAVITKMKFLGMDDDDQGGDDPVARLDAEFVLMTGTLRRMLADLQAVLG